MSFFSNILHWPEVEAKVAKLSHCKTLDRLYTSCLSGAASSSSTQKALWDAKFYPRLQKYCNVHHLKLSSSPDGFAAVVVDAMTRLWNCKEGEETLLSVLDHLIALAKSPHCSEALVTEIALREFVVFSFPGTSGASSARVRRSATAASKQRMKVYLSTCQLLLLRDTRRCSRRRRLPSPSDADEIRTQARAALQSSSVDVQSVGRVLATAWTVMVLLLASPSGDADATTRFLELLFRCQHWSSMFLHESAFLNYVFATDLSHFRSAVFLTEKSSRSLLTLYGLFRQHCQLVYDMDTDQRPHVTPNGLIIRLSPMEKENNDCVRRAAFNLLGSNTDPVNLKPNAVTAKLLCALVHDDKLMDMRSRTLDSFETSLVD